MAEVYNLENLSYFKSATSDHPVWFKCLSTCRNNISIDLSLLQRLLILVFISQLSLFWTIITIFINNWTGTLPPLLLLQRLQLLRFAMKNSPITLQNNDIYIDPNRFNKRVGKACDSCRIKKTKVGDIFQTFYFVLGSIDLLTII